MSKRAITLINYPHQLPCKPSVLKACRRCYAESEPPRPFIDLLSLFEASCSATSVHFSYQRLHLRQVPVRKWKEWWLAYTRKELSYIFHLLTALISDDIEIDGALLIRDIKLTVLCRDFKISGLLKRCQSKRMQPFLKEFIGSKQYPVHN